MSLRSIHLTSNRNAKRTYPIAARELPDFFLPTNLQILANDLEAAKVTERVRLTDVRGYLRQQLSVAYDNLIRPVGKLSNGPAGPARTAGRPDRAP